MAHLQQTLDALQPEKDYVEPQPETPPAGAATKAETAVPIEKLRELNASLVRLPDGFSIHRKLERVREKRPTILDADDERTVDWAAAEELALASILADGTPVRLTGEDVERGTFSHRHAVFHDTTTGARHVPLQQMPQARAAFEICNSPLTENALIGFEFGYNIQEPTRLVIWEAQYGDFINGAQTMIDEFLVSARGKWGLRPSLVLLLPHAHEGQGPDHASARPGALPPARGRHQHADRQLHDRGAVLPPAAPPGGAADDRSVAARHPHAQEPAAASARRLRAARAGRGPLPAW